LLASRGWFGAIEISLLKTSVMRRTNHLSNWLARRMRPHGGEESVRLHGIPFATAWQLLVDELSNCAVSRLEMRIWSGGDLRSVHAWSSDREVSASHSSWRTAMIFSHGLETSCELIVCGEQAVAEATNVSRVSHLLKLFGQHWASHPGQVPDDQPQLGLPRMAHTLRLQRRAAA
jgi:hypothetical protein